MPGKHRMRNHICPQAFNPRIQRRNQSITTTARSFQDDQRIRIISQVAQSPLAHVLQDGQKLYDRLDLQLVGLSKLQRLGSNGIDGRKAWYYITATKIIRDHSYHADILLLAVIEMLECKAGVAGLVLKSLTKYRQKQHFRHRRLPVPEWGSAPMEDSFKLTRNAHRGKMARSTKDWKLLISAKTQSQHAANRTITGFRPYVDTPYFGAARQDTLIFEATGGILHFLAEIVAVKGKTLTENIKRQYGSPMS
ncbi:Uu.00g027580.m01.CDS01 [Anthostomella pinea]|uniref:Uu.00g027580.m01.CDS01 n=1 Tax=Anthostomella pinea TaxID=933095 RepID=A0AAI8YCN9_9PEZI|nr:Uu.00g027580.m01.CDS01 [Anthostomella pinea]